MPLVLASRSPRRAALLRAAGLSFSPGPAPDVDETPPPGLRPSAVARRLATAKARAVAAQVPRGQVVLAADTVVALSDAPGAEALGKPDGPAAALALLRRLRGRRHRVFTGVALLRGRRLVTGVAAATVEVRRVSDAVLRRYVATGEPFDKAGGYGIQGAASAFVRLVAGGLDTVIGLPIPLVRRCLRRITLPTRRR